MDRQEQDVRSRVVLPPHHPIRALIDEATRPWRLNLIAWLIQSADEDPGAVSELDQLRSAVAQRDLQGISTILLKSFPRWPLFSPPPPPSQIELDIQGVETPQTWVEGQSIRVHFVLRNNSSQPTAGFVYGTLTLGGYQQFASARWFQKGAVVDGLPPGQVFTGTLELNRWADVAPAAGPAEIDLQYWTEDPNGSITFVWGSSLQPFQQEATYAAVSFAQQPVPVDLKSFSRDILPLFRQEDIDHMIKRPPDTRLDLTSYDEVKAKAIRIHDALNAPQDVQGSMPVGQRWPQEWIDLFQTWMNQGALR